MVCENNLEGQREDTVCCQGNNQIKGRGSHNCLTNKVGNLKRICSYSLNWENDDERFIFSDVQDSVKILTIKQNYFIWSCFLSGFPGRIDMHAWVIS